MYFVTQKTTAYDAYRQTHAVYMLIEKGTSVSAKVNHHDLECSSDRFCNDVPCRLTRQITVSMILSLILALWRSPVSYQRLLPARQVLTLIVITTSHGLRHLASRRTLFAPTSTLPLPSHHAIKPAVQHLPGANVVRISRPCVVGPKAR